MCAQRSAQRGHPSCSFFHRLIETACSRFVLCVCERVRMCVMCLRGEHEGGERGHNSALQQVAQEMQD